MFGQGLSDYFKEIVAENERLRAIIKQLDAQSVVTGEPHYVAVPAKLLADAVIHEQSKDGKNG